MHQQGFGTRRKERPCRAIQENEKISCLYDGTLSLCLFGDSCIDPSIRNVGTVWRLVVRFMLGCFNIVVHKIG
jgi:hypothetical protein